MTRWLCYGVVGVGANVYGMHRPALLGETAEVVGVNDLNGAVGRERAAELGCDSHPDLRRCLRALSPRSG